MKSNYKKIGDHIQLVDERNKGLQVKRLLGLSISKKFIPSVANIIGTDMENYKIIRKKQFACSTMQVRRDKKMPVALLQEVAEAIISQAYPVFEVKDESELLPEYLMMWFTRSEFDREACFHAVGGVRGSLEWEDFENLQLPIPSITKQREIVKEYNVIQNRIDLNQQLIQKLEETAQAIYKQWFVDFEFPDENGKPYKSNGGEMEMNKDLEREIPKGWEVNPLSNFCDVKGGKRLPKNEEMNDEKNGNPYIKVADMSKSKFLILNDKFQHVEKEVQKIISRYIVSEGDVIISIVGTIGSVNIIHETLDKANLTENCMKLTNLKKMNADFLYHFLSSSIGQQIIETRTVGGVQGKLPMYNIQAIPIIYPTKKLLSKFEKIISGINSSLKNCTTQNAKLSTLKDLFLSKLATIKN